MMLRLIKVVVLLLLGATVNIAVAWGVVIWGEPPLRSFNALEFTPDSWFVAVPHNWKLPSRGAKESSIGADAMFLSGEDGPTDLDFHEVLICQSGWPCRSMFWHAWVDPLKNARGTEFRETGNMWVDGIDLQPAEADHAFQNWRRLPICPVWPGFAIDTLFYSAMLWLLFAAPFALRRRRRIKRGLCPACAYPVGKSDVCTECGAPVAKRAGNAKEIAG